VGRGGLRRKDWPIYVYSELRPYIRFVNRPNRGDVELPGIIDQDVEPAEFFDRRIHESFRLGRIADIRVDRLCLPAVTADALGQGFRVFLRRCIINSDRCSFCRKPLCDRRADSPRRSRNERDLSLKLLHGADPHWFLDYLRVTRSRSSL
jgi:hypothetical protein